MLSPPIAIHAMQAALRVKPSHYPEPFASRMAGREKRPLGEVFGLERFGINLTHLLPGGRSSLRHGHSRQDEFVYILQGRPTLHTDAGKTLLEPGMCAGFRAGSGDAHCLVNESSEEVHYLEIGDRSPDDVARYPDDDLKAVLIDGNWRFTHKDDSPYPLAQGALP